MWNRAVGRRAFSVWQPWRSVVRFPGAPYDLAGGTVAAANPFKIETLTDGEHTLTALIDRSGSLGT